MSTVISLPDGGSAHIMDRSQLSERKRRPVAKALAAVAASMADVPIGDDGQPDQKALVGAMAASGMDAMSDVNDLIAVTLITAWSYEAPVSLDALLDLPSSAYDAIRAKLAPYWDWFTPTDFGPSPDPETPTVPSAG